MNTIIYNYSMEVSVFSAFLLRGEIKAWHRGPHTNDTKEVLLYLKDHGMLQFNNLIELQYLHDDLRSHSNEERVRFD